MRTVVSTSGLPALLDDAIEAILVTARLPRGRDRQGMVDIALVLRDCGSGRLLIERGKTDQTGEGEAVPMHPPGHDRPGRAP